MPPVKTAEMQIAGYYPAIVLHCSGIYNSVGHRQGMFDAEVGGKKGNAFTSGSLFYMANLMLLNAPPSEAFKAFFRTSIAALTAF